jgi:hypothetical protein
MGASLSRVHHLLRCPLADFTERASHRGEGSSPGLSALGSEEVSMDVQNRIIGIVGRKGSGKSTQFREVLQRCPRLFLFDAMGEHRWVPNRFTDLDAVLEFLAWVEASKVPTFAGGYIPEGGLEQDFRCLSDELYETGNVTFGVEEVAMLCSPSYLPPEFDRIVRLGRHRRVNVIWTAQRMAEVARRLTAATDYFVLFAHTEPRDLDAIAERGGRELADRIAGLGLHGCIGWDVVEQQEVPAVVLARLLQPVWPL